MGARMPYTPETVLTPAAPRASGAGMLDFRMPQARVLRVWQDHGEHEDSSDGGSIKKVFWRCTQVGLIP